METRAGSGVRGAQAVATVLDAAARLRDAVAPFAERGALGQAVYVLSPLSYAWPLHEAYVRRFAPPDHRVEAILLGMNPGPWGMGQTGIPFGSPDMVRGFLGLRGEVSPPAHHHPKRPILGLESPRNEVSGQRLWGAIRARFGAPEPFFERFFVLNYCPLLFQNERGANLTPDKLAREEVAPVLEAADRHLEAVVRALEPQTVIGVGAWAAKRAKRLANAGRLDVRVGRILHPSPASPAANRGWAAQARTQLAALGHPF